jgi:hypothetical protein
MTIFLDAEVPRVKLTDRTFNAVESFALEIWGFLIENDNGVTNFHFEIAADLLSEKALALLERARPGLFQFEIGVQSTNGYALAEVSRATDVLRLLSTVRRIRSFRNIHLHLDLIAGLPGEGLESFKKSFNDVYDTRPDQIQLGFLKLLKGTRLRERAGEWGIVYGQYPPYEVLRTRWLSYDDLLALKDVAEMAGVFYNSGKFTWTLTYLVKYFASYYAFYESLADYWRERGYFNAPNGKWLAHDALYGFCEKYCADETEREIILDFMRFDLYANENERGAPECCGKKRVGVSRGGRPERGRDYRVEFFRFDLLAWVVGIYGENPPPIVRRENFLRFEYPDVGRQSAFTLLDRVKEEGMR